MIPNLNLLIAFVILFSYFEYSFGTESFSAKKSRILSRKRRYVAFPEGSSFSAAGCMTVAILGEPAGDTAPGMMTFGLNWGIAYELPNETQSADAIKSFKNKNTRIIAKRRNRRDLYEKLEVIMDNMGYNGRECILRALCETSQRIMPRGSNMMEEMFRLLFSFPLTKVFVSEPPVHAVYEAAHRLGTMLENCQVYKCPLSLVDLAMGYYNDIPSKDDFALNPWSLFSNTFGK